MKLIYIGTLVLIFIVAAALCRAMYTAGYGDGIEEAPQVRIDETEAYALGWKEGRDMQSFLPVPDKWVDAEKARISFKVEDVKVIGILTTNPNDENGCIAWECLEENQHPHVLKHYGYATDEVPANRYYYIGVWNCPNPWKKIKVPEQ